MFAGGNRQGRVRKKRQVAQRLTSFALVFRPTSRRRAAALLEQELRTGKYAPKSKTTWRDFTWRRARHREHCHPPPAQSATPEPLCTPPLGHRASKVAEHGKRARYSRIGRETYARIRITAQDLKSPWQSPPRVTTEAKTPSAWRTAARKEQLRGGDNSHFGWGNDCFRCRFIRVPLPRVSVHTPDRRTDRPPLR